MNQARAKGITQKLKERKWLSIRQIERATGISRGVVEKYRQKRPSPRVNLEGIKDGTKGQGTKGQDHCPK